jgi:hypothetical protein
LAPPKPKPKSSMKVSYLRDRRVAGRWGMTVTVRNKIWWWCNLGDNEELASRQVRSNLSPRLHHYPNAMEFDFIIITQLYYSNTMYNCLPLSDFKRN